MLSNSWRVNVAAHSCQKECVYKTVQMINNTMVHSPIERLWNPTFLCACMKSCFTVLRKPWYHLSLASVYEIISLYHIFLIYKERDSLYHPNSVVCSFYRVPGEWTIFFEIQDLSSLLQLRSTEFTDSVDKSTTQGHDTCCNLFCFSEKVSHGA